MEILETNGNQWKPVVGVGGMGGALKFIQNKSADSSGVWEQPTTPTTSTLYIQVESRGEFGGGRPNPWKFNKI